MQVSAGMSASRSMYRRLPPEEWRPVRGYPGYLVSSRGRVQNKATQRILKPRLSPEGYHRYRLKNTHWVYKNVRVHRLVAQAFIPNPFKLPSVHHLNNSPADNFVENLAWASYVTQIKERRKFGEALRKSVEQIRTISNPTSSKWSVNYDHALGSIQCQQSSVLRCKISYLILLPVVYPLLRLRFVLVTPLYLLLQPARFLWLRICRLWVAGRRFASVSKDARCKPLYMVRVMLLTLQKGEFCHPAHPEPDPNGILKQLDFASLCAPESKWDRELNPWHWTLYTATLT